MVSYPNKLEHMKLRPEAIMKIENLYHQAVCPPLRVENQTIQPGANKPFMKLETMQQTPLLPQLHIFSNL